MPRHAQMEVYRLKVKKFKIHAKYYLRAIMRQLFARWLSFILFFISLGLFGLVLIPNLLMHRLPIFGQWPIVFKLEGKVQMKTTDTTGKIIYVPAGGVILEAGGYKIITEPDGTYRFTFISKRREDIPIVLSKGKITVVERITFPLREFKMRKDFLLK